MYIVMFTLLGLCALPGVNNSQGKSKSTTPFDVVIRMKQDTILSLQSEVLQQQSEAIINLKTK